MADRAYLSIGEVLTLLRPEFEDLTISKIRFLESQGLLDPERTPSGYRKFYDEDVERLRWILRQQREQYLPLKVIKGRLGFEVDDEAVDTAAAGSAAARLEAEAGAFGGSPLPPPPRAGLEPDPGPEWVESAESGDGVARLGPEGPEAPEVPVPAAAEHHVSSRTRVETERLAEAPNPLQAGDSGVTMTLQQLSEASGLSLEEIASLQKYGLIAGKSAGRAAYFDDEALTVAKLARRFLQLGMEPRHLRMYKTAAERETGLFQQLTTPLVKQRNPTARKQAVETLTELATLGQGMRAAMLRQALQDHVGG